MTAIAFSLAILAIALGCMWLFVLAVEAMMGGLLDEPVERGEGDEGEG